MIEKLNNLPSSFCFLKAAASSAVKSPLFNTTTTGCSSSLSSKSSSVASGNSSLCILNKSINKKWMNAENEN